VQFCNGIAVEMPVVKLFMNFFKTLINFITFWKRRNKSNIPGYLSDKAKSSVISEKAAAVKVIKFAKRHALNQDEISVLFGAEFEYEQKKYLARQDFPHQPLIRKADIAEAKKSKYERLKNELDHETYRIYRIHRQNQRKKYPSKY